MSRYDPCEPYRFRHDVVLLSLRRPCQYPLSYEDVRRIPAQRGVIVKTGTRWR